MRSRQMPALFTTTCRSPKASIALFTIRPASAWFVMSFEFGTALPPIALISPTVRSAAAGLMSLITTLAPSFAKASAYSRPSPPPAPVMITTRPSQIPAMSSCSRLSSVRRSIAAPWLDAAKQILSHAARAAHGRGSRLRSRRRTSLCGGCRVHEIVPDDFAEHKPLRREPRPCASLRRCLVSDRCSSSALGTTPPNPTAATNRVQRNSHQAPPGVSGRGMRLSAPVLAESSGTIRPTPVAAGQRRPAALARPHVAPGRPHSSSNRNLRAAR